MKRTFAFTVYDAPMLHHGLNIIVKHMAVLWWINFFDAFVPWYKFVEEDIYY